MGGSKREITLKINAKTVSVSHFSDALRNIQGIVNNIGGVLKTKRKREETKLIIKDIKMGSAQVVLEVASPQVDLDTEQTFGSRIVDRAKKVHQNLVSKPDKEFLSKTLPIEYFRPTLKDFYRLCTPKKDIKSISIAFGDESLQEVNLDNCIKIKELITPEEPKKETLIGRLMGIDVNKKIFSLDTDKGKIRGRYYYTLDSKMKRLLENFVKVSTMVKEKEIIDEINDITLFESTDNYLLRKIMFKGEIIELKQPLELSMEFIDEEKVYVLENKEFNLFTISDTLHGGINEFCEQLETLWEVYVEDTSIPLNKDALKLREKLRKLVGR